MATMTRPTCSKAAAPHPQDCCWGVPVVSMCVCFLICMAQSSTGYLYVLFMEKYQINRGMASWPDSIILFCQNLGGFLVSLLLTKISIYYVALISTAVSCVGLACAAFAPNITWMSVTLGAVYGTGFGASLLSLTVFTMLYFDKYRATATAFKYVGWAISGVAGPLVFSALVKRYGLTGALLLSSSTALHALPLVMFLKYPRPVNFKCDQRKFLTSDSKSDRKGRAKEASLTQKEGLSSTVQNDFQKEHQVSLGDHLKIVRSISRECDKRSVLPPTPSDVFVTTNTTGCAAPSTSLRDGKELSAQNPFHTISAQCDQKTCDKRSVLPPTPLDVFVTTNTTGCAAPSTSLRDGKELSAQNPFHTISAQWDQKTFGSRKTLVGDLCRQLTLFRDSEFYILLVALTLFDFSVTMHTTTTVDYGRDKGATIEDATMVITYNAVGQFLGRTLLPFASDSVVNGRCKFSVACLGGAAVFHGVLSSVNSFGAFVSMNIALSVSEGFVTCIRGVLVNDHLAVERLPAFCGFQGMATVPFSFSGPIIIGFFRDSLGSYDNFYRMLGAVNLCVAALLFILLWQDTNRQRAYKLSRMEPLSTGAPACVSDALPAYQVERKLECN
ncbi:uncharacterized protein LOC144146982 [Haemaphysalis longicornis]